MKWAHLRKFFGIKMLDGVSVIFIDHTYHAGASTNNKKNALFFCHLVKTEGNTGRGCSPFPSDDKVQVVFMQTCQDLDSDREDNKCKNGVCMKCDKKNARTLNFTDFNLEKYKGGQILGGGIEEHRWAV